MTGLRKNFIAVILAVFITASCSSMAYAQEAQTKEAQTQGSVQENAEASEEQAVNEEEKNTEPQTGSETIETGGQAELSGVQKAVALAIGALPDKGSVTQGDEKAILAARTAYESLSEGQKVGMDTARLTDAEDAFAAITGKQRYRYPVKADGNDASMTYMCVYDGDAPAVSVVDPKGVVMAIAGTSDTVKTSSVTLTYTWNETYLQLDMTGMASGDWQVTSSKPMELRGQEYAGGSGDIQPAGDGKNGNLWKPGKKQDYSSYIMPVIIIAFLIASILMRSKKTGKQEKKEDTGSTPDRDVTEFDRLREERMAEYRKAAQSEYDYDAIKEEPDIVQDVVDRDDDESITGRTVHVNTRAAYTGNEYLEDVDETRAVVPVKRGFYPEGGRRF